jgi:UDPglucose 6-dehydrogenase
LGLAYKPDTYIVEESAGLHLAQQLKRWGRRVLVHDFAATPANSPSLFEFEVIDKLESLRERGDIKVAVLCCPWPEYKGLQFHPGTKVIAHWKMQAS